MPAVISKKKNRIKKLNPKVVRKKKKGVSNRWEDQRVLGQMKIRT